MLRKLKYLAILGLSVLSHVLVAQNQTIRGIVKDSDSDFPLPGVSVVVSDLSPILGAVSDANGRITIENVPPGRHTLEVKYMGYKSQTLSNVMVTAGKEVVLDISLVESVEMLKEIVVTAENNKDRPINEMAKVSARTFSLEEVTRYSGGRNDVARLAANFAGVNAANDSRNDIVVRGNSPIGLLWRVEGLPVPTTNHFSTLGTTGGPVSALNTNLLKTSDFLTGAFPAEYGNANAAVFDVKFRNGNTETHEFTAQMAAFSGLEFMAEGPLNRKKQSSYLISYRYGIASLAATGTSAIPYYQDLSFKLNFGESKLGRFELFGLGGISNIDFLGDEIDENDLFADPTVDSYVKNRIGTVGLSHTYRLSNQAYLKTTLGATLMELIFDQDNYINDSLRPNFGSKYQAVAVEDRERRYTLNSQYNKKYSSRFNLRAGGMLEVYHLSSSVLDRDRRSSIPDLNDDGIPDYFLQSRDVDTYSPLVQIYAQGDYKFTDALSWNFGLHAQYFEFSNSQMVGPRSALSWQYTPKRRLSLAYGLHGQSAPFPVIALKQETSAGIFEETNKDLDFIKSHHFVLGHDWKFAPSWRLKTEAYYQYIFDAPVEAVPSSYSVLNEGSNFVFNERGGLVNTGIGNNLGLEITLEKFFSNNYYLLATTSLFDSRYEGSDGVDRQTAFNTQYVLNVLGGKEFKIDDRKIITLDARLTTSGGRPFTPIDLEATRNNGGREVLQETLAFSERLEGYFRMDVKIGFRLNSKKSKFSQQFFVDLQNVTNRKNIFTRRYNPVTDQINDVYQIGFFPDILYRVNF